MSTAPNGPNGELLEPLYVLYDKNKEAQQGWVWHHRELLIEEIKKFYRDFLSGKFGNGIPSGKGFARFDKWQVLFQYFPRKQDDKNRDHWVLLMAWIPSDVNISDIWRILDNDIFQHFADGKDDLPKTLSPFDYEKKTIELTYNGGDARVSTERGRGLIEDILKRGAVNVTFYCEMTDDGKAKIETQKKTS